MRRVRLGFFAAGIATFGLLYAPQSLLPQIAGTFRVNLGSASLAMAAGPDRPRPRGPGTLGLRRAAAKRTKPDTSRAGMQPDCRSGSRREHRTREQDQFGGLQ
jgi:hypothetical protein